MKSCVVVALLFTAGEAGAGEAAATGGVAAAALLTAGDGAAAGAGAAGAGAGDETLMSTEARVSGLTMGMALLVRFDGSKRCAAGLIVLLLNECDGKWPNAGPPCGAKLAGPRAFGGWPMPMCAGCGEPVAEGVAGMAEPRVEAGDERPGVDGAPLLMPFCGTPIGEAGMLRGERGWPWAMSYGACCCPAQCGCGACGW
jgi:hypothetical protein